MKKLIAIIFSGLFLASYSLHGFASVNPVSDDQNKSQASDGTQVQKHNKDDKRQN